VLEPEAHSGAILVLTLVIEWSVLNPACGGALATRAFECVLRQGAPFFLQSEVSYFRALHRGELRIRALTH